MSPWGDSFYLPGIAVNILTTKSERQLLRHLVDAVKAGNLAAFDDHIAMGRGFFGDATVVLVLNEHLPLELDVAENFVRQQFLSGNDLDADVGALLGELMQVAAGHGLEIGVDLIAGREGSTPVLQVSPRAEEWLAANYPPHALAQCRPWLRPLGSP